MCIRDSYRLILIKINGELGCYPAIGIQYRIFTDDLEDKYEDEVHDRIELFLNKDKIVDFINHISTNKELYKKEVDYFFSSDWVLKGYQFGVD